MPTPSQCRNFARFVLVWFACALGVAAASPLVRGQHQQLICSAAGHLQFVTIGDDGGVVRDAGGLQDCPLCILAGAPPQQLRFAPAVPACAAAAEPVRLPVHPAARSAPPLPPRGPPITL